jgi:sirohydrochlorin ferrochelatase
MVNGTLILLGRQTARSDGTIETHAERLRQRGVAETVQVERYDETWSPAVDEDVVDECDDRTDEDVFVVPIIVAETNETRDVIPAFGEIIDSATLCDPVGRSPAVTDAIAERAAEQIRPHGETSLVLVGLGSSSMPHQRRTLEYHERRLRERTDYGEVTSAYLLQDPTVECAHYNVTNEQTVVVPVFITPCAATEEVVAKFGRDGVEHADSLGTHPRLTDAICAEVAKHRALEAHAEDS